MQNSDPRTAGQLQTMIVLWAALLMSQLLFLLLVFFIKPGLFPPQFSAPLLGDDPAAVVVLAAAALTVVVISFFVRAQSVRKGIESNNVGLIQTGLIMGCALCETSSLIGVLLAVAFDYRYFFFWIALGIIGMILHFPRRTDIEAANFRKL
jgi:hypothetical protein